MLLYFKGSSSKDLRITTRKLGEEGLQVLCTRPRNGLDRATDCIDLVPLEKSTGL